MTRVLAAIDGSPVSTTVMTVAKEAARLMEGDLDAIHVAGQSATAAADAKHVATDAGVRLRLREPPVIDAIVAEAAEPDVAIVVLGLRRVTGGSIPPRHVALVVIERAHTPVVGVPRAASPRFALRKVLVPVAMNEVPEGIVRIARDADLEVVLLHVQDELSIPSFEDQPYYDTETWTGEFVARWVPGARHDAMIDLRVGPPEEAITRSAREVNADVVALGWSQDLSPVRASVVDVVLDQSTIPVALMPVRVHNRVST
jgi:hypothetical protein